jgi:large subunit ribosomal protein L25
MTSSTILTAYQRDVVGKASHRLAAEGRIPAVLYGTGREAISLSVDRHDFELLIAHHSTGSTIFELEVEGEKTPVNALIRELQTNPVKGTITHIDFLAVAMDQLIQASVTLHFVNDPAGVRAGGVLTTNFHEITVEAKPGDLPAGLDVDIAALEIGDSLHVSDIVVPAGVTIVDDPGEVLISVQAPRLEVEEEVEGEGEEAEPEVIGEKAEEE